MMTTSIAPTALQERATLGLEPNMANEAIYKVLDLPKVLSRKQVVRNDGTQFGFGWAVKVVRYLTSEPAAYSVNYPATLWLGGKPYAGEVEIRRDGSHAVRRT